MKRLLLLTVLLIACGCSGGKSPSGKPRYRIELYTGLTVKIWEVGSYYSGYGYIHFTDPTTGHRMYVQGTVLIAEQE